MKILAFTDVHGDLDMIERLKSKAKKENVQYSLCCGDITNMGASLRKVVRKISEIPSTILMIHGNHEDPALLEKECENYENIIFLHSSAYREGKYLFFGYGGGGFSVNDESFSNISKQFSKDVGKDDNVIVLFHGPPYGILDETHVGNVGNKDYREFIDNLSPVKVLCGHIHETAGRIKHVDKTKVVNPGPEGMIFDI